MAKVPNSETPLPAAPQPGGLAVVSRKVFSRSSEEPPIFINSAEFAAMGMDVFMDVGVVPAESLGAAVKFSNENPGVPAPVDFHVSFRFGMSVQSAIMIHQRLSQLIQQHAEMAARTNEQAKG